MQRDECDADTVLKVALMGSVNTGKTALLHRYADNVFLGGYCPTIGVDVKSKLLNIQNRICRLRICAISVNEDDEQYIQKYMLDFIVNRRALILFFDLTNHDSFENIRLLKKKADDKLKQNKKSKDQLAWFLVGTKNDLEDRRAVTKEEAQALAKEIGATYFETSAKTGENVEALFAGVATQCLENVPAVKQEVEQQQYGSTSSSSGALETKANCHNACSFFSVVAAGAVGGACVGAGVGLILSGATFGLSAIAGMVIGAFLGAVIAAITYSCAQRPTNCLIC